MLVNKAPRAPLIMHLHGFNDALGGVGETLLALHDPLKLTLLHSERLFGCMPLSLVIHVVRATSHSIRRLHHPTFPIATIASLESSLWNIFDLGVDIVTTMLTQHGLARLERCCGHPSLSCVLRQLRQAASIPVISLFTAC